MDKQELVNAAEEWKSTEGKAHHEGKLLGLMSALEVVKIQTDKF